MARAKYQKAAKDYPAVGIKKGDMYYYARIKTGPRSSKEIRQLKPIRASQLTSSDYLSQAFALQERLDDFSPKTLEEVAEELNSIAEDARALGEEQNDKFSNMESEAPGLAQGHIGELLQERASAMDAWADSLEQAASEAGEKATEYEDVEAKWVEYDEAMAAWDGETEDDEPTEPDEERLYLDDTIQGVIADVEQPEIG